MLRVDRIASAVPLTDTFTPPPGLDPLRVLEEHLSQGWKFPVDVLIDAPPAEVAWWLPRSLGALSPAGDGQTRLLASTDTPDWYAGRLAALPYSFQVRESAAVAGRAHRTRPPAARGGRPRLYQRPGRPGRRAAGLNRLPVSGDSPRCGELALLRITRYLRRRWPTQPITSAGGRLQAY